MKITPCEAVPARIMFVVDSPSVEEENRGTLFVGGTGQEFDRMLAEAGIHRTDCFVTSVCRDRPPGSDLAKWLGFKQYRNKLIAKKGIDDDWETEIHGWYVHPAVKTGFEALRQEIVQVKPTIIVPLGDVSLWAITGGLWGIHNWRGSELFYASCKIIPTLSPHVVLTDWTQRGKVVTDLRRVSREQHSPHYPVSPWKFHINPTFREVIETLTWLKEANNGTLVWDIETARGHIACIGVAWSINEALCIPFTRSRKETWSLEEEATIVLALWDLMRDGSITHIFQNGLYDEQYFYAQWHFAPTLLHGNVRDTMVQSHVNFLRQDKDLATQASLFNEHYRFWKLDGKDWHEKGDESLNWRYNCEDCVRTWECDEVLSGTTRAYGHDDQSEFQHALRAPVLWAMQRGVRIDADERERLKTIMDSERKARQVTLRQILGYDLNTKSYKQMQELFYEDMGLAVIRNRDSGSATLGDDALVTIKNRDPILAPFVNVIREIQTIRTIKSNFLDSEVDPDGRMRCMFQVAGPYTLRLSSSENAFGRGGNMQNLPTRGTRSDRFKDLEVPDVRSLYVPDEGFTFWNLDLDRADLQVVVWESGDDELKRALRSGMDMHLLAVRDIFGIDLPDDELLESHPKCKEHKLRYALQRALCKQAIHATNYGASSNRLSVSLGRPVKECKEFQQRWFGAHPGIWNWRQRVLTDLENNRAVTNKFGYVWRVQHRWNSILPDALAWIPQSTVACVINRVWLNLWKEARNVEVLIQVHDSLAGQYWIHDEDLALNAIKKCSQIIVPYDDPLIIPVSLKTSNKSWGDCK